MTVCWDLQLSSNIIDGLYSCIHVPSCSLLSLLGRETLLLALGNVALSEPLAGLCNLDNVDVLLEGHDGEGYDGQDPGDSTIHLVGTVGYCQQWRA